MPYFNRMNKALQHLIGKPTRVSKTVLTGVLIASIAVSTAQAELSIQEKNPQDSVINQYASIKNKDTSSLELRNLAIALNQRVANNPKDSSAWEVLAQIYYSNNYHVYAVYAASEAIDLGNSNAELQKILLNSSAMVAKRQLQANYLADDIDEAFVTEYQHALSKIYGEVHGFNYDESLPKPPVVRVKPRASTPSRPRRNTTTPSRSAATPSTRRAATPARAKPVPVKRTASPAPAVNKSASSTDPFANLRQ